MGRTAVIGILAGMACITLLWSAPAAPGAVNISSDRQLFLGPWTEDGRDSQLGEADFRKKEWRRCAFNARFWL